MATFARSDELQAADFVDANLHGARFVRADLSGVVMRGVDVQEARRAGDPDGLRAAGAMLERTCAATLERVAAMPAGTVDVSVGGEWSFAQTLRHLVMATDAWLGQAILEVEQPFHPIGAAAVAVRADALPGLCGTNASGAGRTRVLA